MGGYQISTPYDEVTAAKFQALNVVSAAALAAQLWEAMICFTDEVEYLWRGHICTVKMVYGCSRYVLLLGQIVIQALSITLHFHQQSEQQTFCHMKLICQTIWTQIGTLLLELVIILRVYALYGRHPVAKWCLSLLFIVSATLEVWGSAIFIDKVSHLRGCVSIRAERISIYLFGIGVGFIQISTVAATIIGLITRYLSGKSHTPLASMVLSQGVMTFFIVLALVGTLTVFSFVRDLDGQNGDSILSWYIAVVSIVTCRLILRMRKLSTSDDSGTSGAESDYFELTVLTGSLYTSTTLYHATDVVKREHIDEIPPEEVREMEEDFEKLKKMKNIKIKRDKNREFLLSTIRDRLKPIGLDLFNITLDKERIDLIVPRAFLHATYGGSPMQIFPRIGPKFLKIHGLNDFMYLSPLFQPEAPQVPGAPGLYLDSHPPQGSKKGQWAKLMRVFTKISDSPSKSQYMGQYQICSCKSLTKDEWAIQSAAAKHIANDAWGLDVCARVLWRKEFGREPTAAEVDRAYARLANKSAKPAPEEIQAAYLKGEEKMGVYTMKCVGYDSKFQIETYKKFQTWVPPPPKERPQKPIEGEKGSIKSNIATKKRKVASTDPNSRRKRKRKNDEEEGEKEDDDVQEAEYRQTYGSEEDMDFELETLIYRSRGTRSRPIRL
ncbi:hypothetical protein JR316_0005354 [Psilocybe cubensis]|uniref:Uncharacterized protein n=2 Tax=Psilocybe cubensis TaxID=181762 RepID=A0A8H7XMA5_PSICU|nr:hypothetical protein JR316_0005354 [Psilocybe cubensis]KAH9483250.1 hypothetical protein JR316_0005354 [Psilocybe cubensis]